MNKNKFVFVALPHILTLYPPSAYGALKPVVNRHNLDIDLVDINLHLSKTVDAETFNEISDYCILSISELSEHARKCMIDSFEQCIDLEQTGWVGISVFSYVGTRATQMLLEWLQDKPRKFNLVLGGNGCMAKLEDYNDQEFGLWCLERNLTDYVVFGEGEKALDNLLAGNTLYPGINNTNFEQIKNLDDLDYPDYSGVQWNDYYDPRLMITGSRGCVRRCTFCDISQSWPKFSYRSSEKLVDEIRRGVHEYGMTNFEFTDSLINGSVSNFNRFNELLIEAKAKDPALEPVRYIGQFICRSKRTMPEVTYELMHYAGCNQITVGIESFSERVRFHMKKKFSDSDIDYHFEQCARWGIPNVILMIVGYPTETASDHKQNVRALYKYKKYSDMGVIFMMRWGFTMTLIHDTPISDMQHDLGLVELDRGGTQNVYNWISTQNPSLDLKERIMRRLELHETSVELGYAVPNSRKELNTLLHVANEYSSKIIPLQTITR